MEQQKLDGTVHSVLFSVQDGQIYMTGAIFRPHLNSNPINTKPNPNPDLPRSGSGVVRIDPLHFLARCHKR